MLTSQRPLVTFALSYAQRNWAVIPCHPVDSAGMCSCAAGSLCTEMAGMHPLPAEGLGAANTNPERIEAWWQDHPIANIGICTGPISRLAVVIVSAPRNDAHAQLLNEWMHALPDSPTVSTFTGECNRYFSLPFGSNDVIGGSNVITPELLPEGVEVRGEGGLVLGPPSIGRWLETFFWEQPPGALAELPAWLLGEPTLIDLTDSAAASSAAERLIHHGGAPINRPS